MNIEDIADPTSLVVGIVAWLVLVIIIWKGLINGEFYTFKLKVGLTIVMLPITIVVTSLTLNRGG